MTARALAVGVAGCGVAGLAAAAFLARAGRCVVAYDSFPAARPIGSGLMVQPAGLAALDALGCGEAVRALGAPVERLIGLSVDTGKPVLDVRYAARGAGRAAGIGVHRGALFSVLLQAAQAAGVEIEPGRAVVGHDGAGRLRFADGTESPRFGLLIDALGLRSPFAGKAPQPLTYGALWANVPWPRSDAFDPQALQQRYRQAHTMAGVMPIGRRRSGGEAEAAFFWSLRGHDLAAWRAAPFGAWKAQVSALWPQTAPLLDGLSDHEQLTFAQYAHRTLPGPLGEGLVHLGDSWRCTSPQLGQGANMALLDAWALSAAMERQPDLQTALGEYARVRLWHSRLYQLVSLLFTPFYQSDSAVLAAVRDHVLAPLAQMGPMPGLLGRLVAGELAAPLAAIRALAPAPPPCAGAASTMFDAAAKSRHLGP